jgi:hypothetical protein
MIHVSPTDVISSIPPPWCRLFFDWYCHAAAPCHTFFPLSKTSSLASLHLSATLCLVTSPLKPKLKHWIRTTAAGYPPQTTRLPPSTAIKNHLNFGHSPHHSIKSLFYLIPSQSTTPLELHPPSSFPFTPVLCPSSLRTMTPTVTT